jgi:hypothetical protein
MVDILWGRNSGLPLASMGMLTLDAALTEDEEYKNRVTVFPVENGLDISDHIRQEPDEFKVEGVVSDTPDYSDAIDGQYSGSAYRALLAMVGRDYVSRETDPIPTNEYPAPIMVDVISKFRVFTDMFLETLHIPRTVNTGDTIQFTAHFKKVRIADLGLANVNYTSKAIGGQDGFDQAQPTVDNGTQTPGKPNDPIKAALDGTAKKFGDWWNGDVSTIQLLGG